jgi:FlaG/FlaF family flagellin (archaellin)
MAKAVTVPLGPARVNITGVRAGDRNLMTITLHSKGDPLNLTDLDVTAQARRKSTDQTPVLSAVVEPIDATLGQVSLRWPGDDVTDLLAGKATWSGVWDLQVGSAGADPTTVCAGSFLAEMDVTRP